MDALSVLYSCLFMILILITIPLIATRYDKIQEQLDFPPESKQFLPKKLNFLLTWYLYLFIFTAPILLALWFLTKDTKGILSALVIISALWLFVATLAHPYNTIVVMDNDVMSGPSLWNWMWRREVIQLNELDKEKIENRNYGRKLGVLIFYAKDGKKILSLGLNNDQINQILDLATETQSEE